MVPYARRNAAIVTSVGAMVATVMLIIFFGAWAVSASGEADFTGVLAGATAGFSGTVSPQSVQSVPTRATGDPNNVPRLATDESGGATVADTWWGKAFLGACPLH